MTISNVVRSYEGIRVGYQDMLGMQPGERSPVIPRLFELEGGDRCISRMPWGPVVPFSSHVGTDEECEFVEVRHIHPTHEQCLALVMSALRHEKKDQIDSLLSGLKNCRRSLASFLSSGTVRYYLKLQTPSALDGVPLIKDFKVVNLKPVLQHQIDEDMEIIRQITRLAGIWEASIRLDSKPPIASWSGITDLSLSTSLSIRTPSSEQAISKSSGVSSSSGTRFSANAPLFVPEHPPICGPRVS